MVVTDSHVDALYTKPLLASLAQAGLTAHTFVFPAGEPSKNQRTLFALLERLAGLRFNRSDAVVALGGGVVGDLAGLAAALYMRGMRFVQLPTTLLAAVDSSVGGKVAIDLPAGKNLVGAFYQPEFVLCDTDTLQTLPPCEWANGQAEVIKYAVLQAPDLLRRLQGGQGWDGVISRCVAIKRDLVCADERETGQRKLLNFGHTFGHAIEQVSAYTVPHGSAVAIGMVLIMRAAVKKGLCDPSCLPQLQQALRTCGLPTATEYGLDALYAAVLSDKKRSADTITLVIPREFGRCQLTPVPLSQVRDLLALGLECAL